MSEKQSNRLNGLLRGALPGRVFAISTLLPEMIQHLAVHQEDLMRIVPGEVMEKSLQVLGCFLVLSALILLSRSQPHPVRPLLTHPPHNIESMTIYIAGLLTGVLLMLR